MRDSGHYRALAWVMDQRTLAAFALAVVMIVALMIFLGFWQGTGLDRARAPGWRRVRRWWRTKRE